MSSTTIVCQKDEFACAGVFRSKKFVWSIPGSKASFMWINHELISAEFYTTNKNPWTIKMNATTVSGNLSFRLRNHKQSTQNSVWLKILNAEHMEYIPGTKVSDNYYHCGTTEYQFTIMQTVIPPEAYSNGNLKVLVKIRENITEAKSCSALGLVDPPPSSLADCLSPYIFNGEFSDIILEIGGVGLKAHKIMLAAQSPVFYTMFKQKMKETNENRVIINDINTAVGEQMLQFVYTNDKPSNIDIFARELLAVAHKYQMNNLQLMCENNLKQKITTSDAVKILIVSNLYGTEKFREFVFDFFCKNLAVLQSNEFKKLRSKDAQLAMEVYDQVIKNKFNL